MTKGTLDYTYMGTFGLKILERCVGVKGLIMANLPITSIKTSRGIQSDPAIAPLASQAEWWHKSICDVGGDAADNERENRSFIHLTGSPKTARFVVNGRLAGSSCFMVRNSIVGEDGIPDDRDYRVKRSDLPPGKEYMNGSSNSLLYCKSPQTCFRCAARHAEDAWVDWDPETTVAAFLVWYYEQSEIKFVMPKTISDYIATVVRLFRHDASTRKVISYYGAIQLTPDHAISLLTATRPGNSCTLCTWTRRIAIMPHG